MIRPAGPVPCTYRSSTPSSQARRRTAGEAIGFSPGARGAPVGTTVRADAGCVRPPLAAPRALGAGEGTGAVADGSLRARASGSVGRFGRGRDSRWRGRRCRRAGGDVAGALDLDADQLGAYRDDVARLARQREHLARNRRRNLDARLVGHDIGEVLVLAHDVARLDVPLDELHLGNALADVRHLDDVGAHGGFASTAP